MSESSSSQREWRRRARQASTKINTAWWLEKFTLPLIVAALIGACVVLLMRRELDTFPWLTAVGIGAGLLVMMGLVAWWVARRQFETEDDAMVRIEASMKLRNSLSAAKGGVAPWPDVPGTIDDGTRWCWPRLLVPLLAAALFLTASFLLPVSAKTDPNAPPVEQPQAWKDLEADLKSLAEENTVQEEYLEEMKDRLEELRRQDQEDWFSHSSLEATDALQNMHGNEVEDLERNLRQAERALRGLQKHGDQMAEGQRERLLNEFEQALRQMGQGKMKPNRELLEQLGEIDPENLGNLNQEQLDQLREQIQKHAQDCENCQGGGMGEGGGGDWLDELLEEGEEQGPENGEGPGRGGVNRGPGTAPGVLGREGGDVQTGDLEGLESKDLDRTLPGDLLELMDGDHEIDESRVGIRAGGGVGGEGVGGDRVWKDSLLPDEKKALREFFK